MKILEFQHSLHLQSLHPRGGFVTPLQGATFGKFTNFLCMNYLDHTKEIALTVEKKDGRLVHFIMTISWRFKIKVKQV